MSTRPTSHSSTTSTPISTTASTTATTTTTPGGTCTQTTVQTGLTDSLSAAMRQLEISPARELADSLTQPAQPETSGTAPGETKARETKVRETKVRETSARPLPEPATWAGAEGLVYTDVSVTDSLIPAVLLRLPTLMTPGGTSRMAVVRIEGNSSQLTTLSGQDAIDQQGGYSTHRLPFDLARLRPAPPTGPLRLLDLEQVASLEPGTHVLVAGAPAVVIGHEIDDEAHEQYLVVCTKKFEPRLHDLHSEMDGDEELGNGGRAPLDGLWKYRIAIDEADVRAVMTAIDTKYLPVKR